MKHFTKLLIVPLLAFFSCSQQADEAWEIDEFPTDPETHTVGMKLSAAAVQNFSEMGITEVGVYVYLKDSLVFGKNLSVSEGNLQVELPLGETLHTFVIANADEMIDTDSLSKVMVRQDVGMQKEVYLSDITEFASDNSVTSLPIELKRLVGQAVFQPRETEEQIRAITQFDQLSLTFTNVGVAYKIQSGECVQEDRTVVTDKAAGFSAFVYSLPTVSGSNRTSIDVVYLKDEQEITRTNSPLDAGIAFEPSKRSIVYMPILEDAYLTNGWSYRAGAKSVAPLSRSFTIEESEF